MIRKTQIQLLMEAKAQLEANIPTSSLIAEIALVLKEPELPFTDGYAVQSPIYDDLTLPPVKSGVLTEEDLIKAAEFIRDSSKPYDYYLNKAGLPKPLAPLPVFDSSIVSGSAAGGKLTLAAQNIQGNTVVLPTDKTFDGKAYDAALDKERLSKQIDRIFKFMKGAQWHTLKEIHDATGAPEASASAQLRNLRKERNGAHTVEHRRKGKPTTGLFEYRLILNTSIS